MKNIYFKHLALFLIIVIFAYLYANKQISAASWTTFSSGITLDCGRSGYCNPLTCGGPDDRCRAESGDYRLNLGDFGGSIFGGAFEGVSMDISLGETMDLSKCKVVTHRYSIEGKSYKRTESIKLNGLSDTVSLNLSDLGIAWMVTPTVNVQKIIDRESSQNTLRKDCPIDHSQQEFEVLKKLPSFCNVGQVEVICQKRNAVNKDRPIKINHGNDKNSDQDRIESSESAEKQMDKLAYEAYRQYTGSCRGRCYANVYSYINAVGYGKIGPGQFDYYIPPGYWQFAKDFANYLNQGNNADKVGLQRLSIDNPFDAPRGAIVVVRPFSPGTNDPIAGDISIADGKGNFYNGGNMGAYWTRADFLPGNNYILGIYIPK